MSGTTMPSVRFGRRQSKGILLGFSGLRLVALAVSLVTFVLPMFLAGVSGLVVAAPVWATPIALAFVRWHGEPVVEALPNLLHWTKRKWGRQHRFRARLLAPRPAGTMALPGDTAALRFHVDVTGAAMVHDPHAQTLSAVVRVSHPAYVLLSTEDQTRRVDAWARVLAGLAATGTCAGVQVLETTLPDPGDGVRQWYLENAAPNSGWAGDQYAALMETIAPTSYTHRTLIVLTLDLRRAARAVREAGRGVAAAADVLRGDMTTLSTSLRSADLRVDGWLGADELSAVIRDAYDPAAAGSAERATLSTAGPVAIDEHWDYLRHDSAYSTVVWISEWPRSEVAPQFLHSLIFLQDVRKTVSVIARPMPSAQAFREIRKEKVDYLTEAQQGERIGKVGDFASEQEYADVLARERALVSGHADLRYSGFVCITADARSALGSAVAAVERAASQCGCETRVLYGQQAQSFAIAALPLGRGVHR